MELFNTKEKLEQVYKTRIEVCKRCDKRRDLPAGMLQCTVCGCLMNIKARFGGQKCPIGKW